MGRDGLAALGAGLALLAILLATAAVLRDRLLAAFGSDLPRLLGVDAGAALATSLRSGAVALAFAAVASLALLASARSRGAARLAAALGAALLAVHAGLESWKVAPVAPAAELRRTPALLTRLAPAAHVEDGQPPRILRSPLVDGELPPRLRAGYRQETLVLDAPGRWGVAAVPGFEGWRSCAFADLWPAAAGMRLDVFQTLYAIDAVALPRDVCAVPRAERPGRRRPRAAHARHRRGGRPRDAFGWTLVRSEGIRPRAFVAPRWRWAAPAARNASRSRALRAPTVTRSSSRRTRLGGRRRPTAPRPRCSPRTCSCAPCVSGPAGTPSSSSYRTPLLLEGVAVSVAAWPAWIALVVRGGVPRVRANGDGE